MAEIIIEKEVNAVMEHIEKGYNFVLNGGAGSGKTYSLVQIIKQILEKKPLVNIACITYTNAAAREIEDRISHKNINISTIHDFLWDNIKAFQKELKETLIELINEDDSKINAPTGVDIKNDYFDNTEQGEIQYKEYLRIIDGFISHDEVLILANRMFKKYPVLRDILIDKFQFVLVDEYQDTNPLVIEILLDHLKNQKRKNIIGFFGDAMQSIYDDGIGDDFNKYVDSGYVKREIKKQNRRNPLSIINLANELRTDSVSQEPSEQKDAPNMQDGKIKKGEIKFLYSKKELSIDNVIKKYKNEYFEDWDFEDTKNTKQLNLTHKLIADSGGFIDLYNIYDADPIVKICSEIRKKCKDKDYDLDVDLKIEECVKTIDAEFPKQKRYPSKKELLIQAKSDIGEESYSIIENLPYKDLKKIYITKDSLIDDKKQSNEEEGKKGSKRDRLIKHLMQIQSIILHYEKEEFSDFIKKTTYPLYFGRDKKVLKDLIDSFSIKGKTIEQVIELAHEKGICLKNDKLDSFIDKNKYLYSRVKNLPYSTFQKLFNYLEGYTPFSTQHKVKGTEFDNVLVLMDDGKWNKYDFSSVFTGTASRQSKLSRSQKIFYVCCTRAKENLIVYYETPSSQVITKAQKWFGKNNVIPIT
ncbi:UvrD-helicase domain-containing protein [Tenacibaculum halocynthiae]|uniref:UvrD-helicase domain-containing protein n=1 Tax=Tenacibaculum halocynthiae TaxID=1254437 RepID=UPI003D64CF6C